MKKTILSFLLVAATCTGRFSFATETEHLRMQVLPAPGLPHDRQLQCAKK